MRMKTTYEFTDNVRVVHGATLRQVRRVSDGQLGAWLAPDVKWGDFDGEFLDGEFFGGAFHGGEFFGGMFCGGAFHGGEFYGGEFHGGEFLDGGFFGGTFFGGTFYGGVFLDGEFRDGEFLGGTFFGGTFRETPPSASRSDGCLFVAIRDANGIVRIDAGCQWFTFEEAREYWTKTQETRLSKESLALIDHLERVVQLLSKEEP